MGKKAPIVDGKKKCSCCFEFKPLNEFSLIKDGRVKNTRVYPCAWCKACCVKKSKKWVTENREKYSKRLRERRAEELKVVYAGYGGACVCCGETNPLFLTIDHVANDGASVRRSNKSKLGIASEHKGSFYTKIIKEGFPKSLQLFCFNCNFGKNRNGGVCPHQDVCQQ